MIVPMRSPAATRRMLSWASSKTRIGSRLSMQSESAVVSMTLRPRSMASRCVSAGMNARGRILVRVTVVDALHAVLRHEDRLGADLERAQRRGGVGREERVPRAGGEDDDALLLQMSDGATPDVRLGDLGDRDRRLDTCVHALPLERVLQRQRVQERREHAGVVGRRPIHPLGRGRHSAVDVPRAHDDRELRSRPRAPRRSPPRWR